MATLDELRAAFRDLADDAPTTCPTDFQHRRGAVLPSVAGRDDLGPARRRVPRWVPPLAAAVVAAAVAGAVVAIQHGNGHRVSPGKSRSVTTSPAPHGNAFCAATLPSAWWVDPIELGSNIEAVTPSTDGTLIVTLAQGSTTETKNVILGNGEAMPLLSEPVQPGVTVDAAADGGHGVLMVRRNHTVTRLYLYDDRDVVIVHNTVQKKQLTFSGIVDDATVMAGTVYWDERGSVTARSGRVIAYDIATGTRRAVWHGTFPDRSTPVLRTAAGGVYLGAPGSPGTVLIAARKLPAIVAAQTTPAVRERLLVSDSNSPGGGASYAWLSSATARVLNVWHPGETAPERVELGTGSPRVVSAQGVADFSIDGRWLYDSQERMLADLDTHAIARLPGDAGPYFMSGPILAGVSGSQLTQLPLTDLPELHC